MNRFVLVSCLLSRVLAFASFASLPAAAAEQAPVWYVMDQPASEPTWPIDPGMIDKRWIWEMPETAYRKYDELRALGYPVMVGEFGCYNKLRYETCLKWMEHCLKLWREKDLDWAIWNLNGSFGFLDSCRKDVVYEDFHGHKLDRRMLEMLQKYAK